ncbi:MAG TPA: ABC transporter ATP-binding protein [Actinomycetota bacterium]|nr:ABC transporter ATP-binding protein [Actinomycetota bacterium]
MPDAPAGHAAPPAVRLTGIWKTFGDVRANRGIDLAVQAGSIHGLLGENGAGKSTLMKILFGLIAPDEGTIEVDGVATSFSSPADALAAGVGMVQQHFSLITDFTVVQNLVLGHEPKRRMGWIDLDAPSREISELSDRYGFRIDPSAKVGTLRVGARQRVEILKALYRGAEVLILDEPTAALTPQEAGELHEVMETLRRQGRTVIFISHKLAEVIELCDRVTILRDGSVVGHREMTEPVRNQGPEREALERDLARMMVGRELPPGPNRPHTAGETVLRLGGATDGDRLEPLDLEVRAGEIVGVAGVEGNGQAELVELILGVRRCTGGRVELNGQDVSRLSVAKRLRSGIGHIAEDRHAAALVLDLPISDNALMGYEGQRQFNAGGLWLAPGRVRRFARTLAKRFRIRTPSVRVPAGSLSGGNQQKLVVARELARKPSLVIASQPTRGLDVAATSFVHDELDDLRAAGTAVLVVSLDLTEVLILSDRIVVMSRGAMVGSADAGEVDEETLGLWMTRGGAGPGDQRGVDEPPPDDGETAAPVVERST